VQYILVKRKVDGPSIPELGQPVALTFDSVRVPLNRPSTGPNPVSAYQLERSTDGSTWAVIATGASIFGNPAAQFVDGGRLASTTYYYRARTTDTGGRVSAYCATVSVTTPQSATGSAYRVLNNEVGYYLQGYPLNEGGIGVNATYRAITAKADVVVIGSMPPGVLAEETTMIGQLRAIRSDIKLLRYTDPIYWYDNSGPGSGSPYTEGWAVINLNNAPQAWSAKNAAGQVLAHQWSSSDTNGINWATTSTATNSLGQTLQQATRYQWQQFTPSTLYDGVFLDDVSLNPTGLIIRGTQGNPNPAYVNWSYPQDGIDYDWLTDYTFGNVYRANIAALFNEFRTISSSFVVSSNTNIGYWYGQYKTAFDWSAGGRPPTPFSSTALYNSVDVGFIEESYRVYGFGDVGSANNAGYRILGWFNLAEFYRGHELQYQNSRKASTNRMQRQMVLHDHKLKGSNTASETQTDYAYARACWAMIKLVEGGMYGLCRTSRQPFFLDETCIKLGAVVGGPRSMGALFQPPTESNNPASFTLRAPNATNGSAQFYWAEFENALVVFRADITGLTPGSSIFGQGASVSYTLPSAGTGRKWQRPNAATYVNPDYPDLAMVGQSTSFNNGADATTSSLLPLHGEVFLRVMA
jgi:hypothetical protein